MRFSTALAALALAACSVMPAFAQEADQQMRQQIETVQSLKRPPTPGDN
jgi:hypothetical protein